MLLTALGVGLMAVGLLARVSPAWTLAGLFFAWAGIVKVIAVAIWHGMLVPSDSPDNGLEKSVSRREHWLRNDRELP